VHAQRLSLDPVDYASVLLRATGTERLLVDDGFPAPGTGTSWAQLGELAGCEAHPVMRIERVAEDALPARSRTSGSTFEPRSNQPEAVASSA
jgi:hypothetical protein